MGRSKKNKFKRKLGKLPLQKNIVRKQDFNYVKGKTQLGFTLSIDDEQEQRDFLKCLFEAKKDVEKMLKGDEE